MNGILALIIAILGFRFSCSASKAMTWAVQQKSQKLYYVVITIISFTIVTVFPHQVTSMTTGIIISFMFNPLSQCWKKEYYGAFICIFIITFCTLGYIFYPTNLTGKILLLILLILGWLTAKYDSFVDRLIKQLIDSGKQKIKVISIKILENFLILLLTKTGRYQKVLLEKISKKITIYLSSK